MPKLSVSQIIAALPLLKPEEREAVQKALSIIVPSKTETKVSNADADPVYEAMLAELRSIGVSQFSTYESFLSTKDAKSWTKNMVQLDQFLEQHFTFSKLTKVKRLALLRALWGCVIADLRGRGWPVSVGSLARNLGRIPVCFDREFPGYLASGLAWLVLNSLDKQGKRKA